MGKVIYMGLEGGGYVRSHLAMSGVWSSRQSPWTYDYVEAGREAGDESHVRVILHLTDGTQVLYHDQRLFGRLELVTDTTLREPGNGWEYLAAGLGIYPEISPGDFFILLRTYRKDRSVRSFLCDQDEVPGIGNIYSAEVLYHARIHPLRPVRSLSFRESTRLLNNVRRELTEAIARGLDYSVLRVYRQDSCWHCQSRIKTVEIDKRTVYYCPVCQYEDAL